MHNGRFGRIGGEHGHEQEMTFVNVLPTQNPSLELLNIFSKGFALNSTTLEPNFRRKEHRRKSFPVGGHVRLQYSQIVHSNTSFMEI